MYNFKSFVITAFASLVILSGCSSLDSASASQRQFYQLNTLSDKSTNSRATSATINAPVVQIMPAIMAPLLQQPGLVSYNKGETVVIAKLHRWAEDLDSAISRHLSFNLEQYQNTINQQDFKFQTQNYQQTHITYKLVLNVEHFNALSESSKAVNAGSFSLYRDSTLIYQQNYDLREHYQGDSYQDMVIALAGTQKTLAKMIFQALEKSQTTDKQVQ